MKTKTEQAKSIYSNCIFAIIYIDNEIKISYSKYVRIYFLQLIKEEKCHDMAGKSSKFDG